MDGAWECSGEVDGFLGGGGMRGYGARRWGYGGVWRSGREVGVGAGGCVGGGWGGSGVKRRKIVEAFLVYRMQGLRSMVFGVNGRM